MTLSALLVEPQFLALSWPMALDVSAIMSCSSKLLLAPRLARQARIEKNRRAGDSVAVRVEMPLVGPRKGHE
jgi:hypothetical protein